jgi:hypothetical protein
MRRGLFVAAATLLAHSTALAQEQKLAFVSCPIVRDTPSVPCWLAEFKGETYYLGIQTDVSADFYPPSLGNRVLVEGERTNEPRICGGIPIKNVVVSVLAERAENCNTLLMAEDRYKLPFEAPRPPGPSSGRLAFAAPPTATPPAQPKPPFKPTTFEINYDFDGTIGFKHPRFVRRAMAFAELSSARSISIVGYRNAVPLSDGGVLTEREGLGEIRAKEIADLLRGAGLTSPKYDVSWVDEPQRGGADQRRVLITVNP